MRSAHHDERGAGPKPEHTYAFFLNCFHLKDWLESDPTFAKAKEVEQYVSTTPSLKMCADIANAAKHLRPAHNPKSGRTYGELHASFRTELAETFAFDGEKRPFTRAVVYLDCDGAPLAVAGIARDAVAAWRSFVA
jgi:hypothetical protein